MREREKERWRGQLLPLFGCRRPRICAVIWWHVRFRFRSALMNILLATPPTSRSLPSPTLALFLPAFLGLLLMHAFFFAASFIVLSSCHYFAYRFVPHTGFRVHDYSEHCPPATTEPPYHLPHPFPRTRPRLSLKAHRLISLANIYLNWNSLVARRRCA